MTDESAWLNSLRAGDKVYFHLGKGYSRIKTVKKVTKTMIMLENNLKFRKSDGVGFGTDSSVYIRKPTPEEIDFEVKKMKPTAKYIKQVLGLEDKDVKDIDSTFFECFRKT